MPGVTLAEVLLAMGGAALVGAVIAVVLRLPQSGGGRVRDEIARIHTQGSEDRFKRPPDESQLL